MGETMTVRVLPADVYDALELSAEAYGGIGAGKWYEGPVFGDGPPVCFVGHAAYAGVVRTCEHDERWLLNVMDADVGELEDISDGAVRAINRRLGKEYIDARVPFDLWCAELGVVRGDS